VASGCGLLLWAVSACSSPVPIGDVRNAAGNTNMDGSGGAGAPGTGGAAGNAGSGGASGDGGASGTSLSDAASDIATDGSGGTSDASTTDGAVEASGPGGDAGADGTSMSDGAAGTGDAISDRQDAVEGGPGTQPACAGLLAMVNRDSWIAFDSDRDGLRRNLYMMHPDRSGLTQLTKGTNVDREPFFSYDGTRLSYSSVVAGKSQIFIMDLATRTSIQVTRRPEGADQSSFSRDGQWVAFHSDRSVHVIKTDGTGERLVGTAPDALASYRWPAFTADGTGLVFDNQNGIDTVKLDGTGLRHVAYNTNTEGPAVSPSGVDVAASMECQAQSIWMSPLGTNTEPCNGRRITPQDGFDSWRPTWGTALVLAYHRTDRATNRAVIAMISAVDSQTCLLTMGPEDSRNASWSP